MQVYCSILHPEIKVMHVLQGEQPHRELYDRLKYSELSEILKEKSSLKSLSKVCAYKGRILKQSQMFSLDVTELIPTACTLAVSNRALLHF